VKKIEYSNKGFDECMIFFVFLMVETLFFFQYDVKNLSIFLQEAKRCGIMWTDSEEVI